MRGKRRSVFSLEDEKKQSKIAVVTSFQSRQRLQLQLVDFSGAQIEPKICAGGITMVFFGIEPERKQKIMAGVG